MLTLGPSEAYQLLKDTPSLSICFALRPGVPMLHHHSGPHVLEITLPDWPCDDFSWPRSRVVTAQDPPPATRSSLGLGGCSGPTVSPPTALTSGSPGYSSS